MRKLHLSLAFLCTLFLLTTIGDKVEAGFSDYFDTIQKLYIGYYQRPADPDGLNWWATELSQAGGNVNAIIEAFATSPESKGLYGTIDSNTIGSVVESVYMALLNRPAEKEGKAWWVAEFNAGRVTSAQIVLAMLSGAQNDDLLTINNKLTAANRFTASIDAEPELCRYSGNDDAQMGRIFLSTVTSDPATIPLGGPCNSPASIPTFYTYTTVLPDGWTSSQATAINNSGQVVGYGTDGSGQYRGFLYSDGTYTVLPLFPDAINDNGQVAGHDGSGGGFIYSNGTYSPLALESVYRVTGISNNGQVVGYTMEWPDQSSPTGGTGMPAPQFKGFIYSNGTYITLLPEDWWSSAALAINNSGQVVGHYYTGPTSLAFLYSNGTYTTLGWESSEATGINNNGQVVGHGAMGRGFLYSNGTYITLLPGTWQEANTVGINNSGEVAGYGRDASGTQRGFVYREKTYTTLLPDAWIEARVMGINNDGQVVGRGRDASGQLRSFVAIPALILTEDQDGETISIRQNGSIQVELGEGGPTAYGPWSVESYNQDVLELVSDECYINHAPADVVGTRDTRVLTFKARAPGTTVLSLVCYPYLDSNKDNPSRFTVLVEVK